MHQAIEVLPLSAQRVEQRLDLGVARDLTGQREVRAELGGHLDDAILETIVLVGEGKLGAFAPRRLRDAVRDRAVGDYAGDQDSLSGEKRHAPDYTFDMIAVGAAILALLLPIACSAADPAKILRITF